MYYVQESDCMILGSPAPKSVSPKKNARSPVNLWEDDDDCLSIPSVDSGNSDADSFVSARSVTERMNTHPTLQPRKINFDNYEDDDIAMQIEAMAIQADAAYENRRSSMASLPSLMSLASMASASTVNVSKDEYDIEQEQAQESLVNDMESLLQRKNEQIASLQSRRNALAVKLREDMSELHSVQSDAASEKITLKSEVGDLTAKLEESQYDLAKSKTRVEEQDASLDSKNAEIVSLTETVEKLTAQVQQQAEECRRDEPPYGVMARMDPPGHNDNEIETVRRGIMEVSTTMQAKSNESSDNLAKAAIKAQEMEQLPRTRRDGAVSFEQERRRMESERALMEAEYLALKEKQHLDRQKHEAELQRMRNEAQSNKDKFEEMAALVQIVRKSGATGAYSAMSTAAVAHRRSRRRLLHKDI